MNVLLLASVTGIAGAVLLGLIALFIVFLFWRRGRIARELAAFYKQNGIVYEPNPPEAIKAALGNPRWGCYRCEIKSRDGRSVPCLWWTGRRFQPGPGNPPGSLHCYLAVSAPAHLASAVLHQAVREMNRPLSFRERLARFFILDTDTAIRAETVVEDMVLLVWPTLERTDIQQRRLQWLRDNL